MNILLNILFKFLLFVSSYIPLFILVFINNIDIKLAKKTNGNNNIIITMIKNTWNEQPCIWLSILILVILSIIPLIIVFYNKENNTNSNRKSFINLESLNGDILNYFITYLVPLLTMNVKEPIKIIVNALIFIIIGVFYISEDLIHLNLIYILLGYKVYKTDNRKILITNRCSDEFKGNKELRYHKLGKSIYVVKKTKK